MNDTRTGVALVLRLVRRRWPVLLLLALLGSAVGYPASFILSPGYVSSTKVLLGGARDATDLPADAQVATSLIVLDKTAADLGWGVTGTQLQGMVSASVDSRVLTISGAADTPARAQQLADRATSQYTAFSGQIVSDAVAATAQASERSRTAVQQQITDAGNRIARLQSSPGLNATGPDGARARDQLERERRALTAATRDLEQIEDQPQSDSLAALVGRDSARILQAATLPTGPASPTVYEVIAGGAVLFVILGIFGHLLALRSDRRLRDVHDVAAALGTPVVCHVEADAGSRRSLLHRFRHDDRSWAYLDQTVPDDEAGRAARYERVLRHLSAAGTAADLVVLVPDDDGPALSAVVDLALAATGEGPVTVITADDATAALVGAAADGHTTSAPLTVGTEAEHVGAGTAIRVVPVAAVKPVVADIADHPAVLLALTRGTRTGWELAGIAGACADAGHDLAGALLVVPSPAPDRRNGKPAPADGPAVAEVSS